METGIFGTISHLEIDPVVERDPVKTLLDWHTISTSQGETDTPFPVLGEQLMPQDEQAEALAWLIVDHTNQFVPKDGQQDIAPGDRTLINGLVEKARADFRPPTLSNSDAEQRIAKGYPPTPSNILALSEKDPNQDLTLSALIALKQFIEGARRVVNGDEVPLYDTGEDGNPYRHDGQIKDPGLFLHLNDLEPILAPDQRRLVHDLRKGFVSLTDALNISDKTITLRGAKDMVQQVLIGWDSANPGVNDIIAQHHPNKVYCAQGVPSWEEYTSEDFLPPQISKVLFPETPATQ